MRCQKVMKSKEIDKIIKEIRNELSKVMPKDLLFCGASKDWRKK